ncbi:hypothetical protein ACFXTI_014454 [Malus domestica]
MSEKFADQFVPSSSLYMMHSYDYDSDTTPERQRQSQRQASSLSEPISLCHSPSSSAHSSSSFKTTSTYGDDSRKGLNKKLGKKSSSFAYRIRDHGESQLVFFSDGCRSPTADDSTKSKRERKWEQKREKQK